MLRLIILSLFFLPTKGFSQAKAKSVHEPILEKVRGFFTCSGGTNAPLFKQDCKLLSVERVSFGGDLKYEAKCKDSSGTTFHVACIAYSFEPDQSVSIPDTNFMR